MAKTMPIRLRTLAASTVVVASGLIIFNAYQSIINSSDNGMEALPIIKADKDPFRVVPDDQGGADILNEGSTVFNTIEQGNPDDLSLGGLKIKAKDQSDTAINLTLSPEKGFDLPVIPERRTESLYGMMADLDADKPVDKPVDTSVNKDAPTIVDETPKALVIEDIEETKPEEATEKPNPSPMVSKPDPIETAVNKPVDIMPLPSRKPSTPTRMIATPKMDDADKPTKNTATEKTFSLDRILGQEVDTKRHYVQLASIKGEEAAKTAYADIRDRFPNIVEGANVFFPQADLGARGVFTRIQLGPFPEEEARKRCADYTSKARGGTCLVVSR